MRENPDTETASPPTALGGGRHYPSPTTAEDCVASLRNAKPNIEGAGISNALRIRFTTSDYRYRNRINELYHENLSENPVATYFSKSPTPRRKTVLQRFFLQGQHAQGDRHVYASRTRFIPDRLLGLFERTSWPLAVAGAGVQGKTSKTAALTLS
jgi:hypothetical protein